MESSPNRISDHIWNPVGMEQQEIVVGSLGMDTHPETHLTLVGTIYPEGVPVEVVMLLDCGATAYLIDGTFAKFQGLELLPLDVPRKVSVIDGREMQSGAITHFVRLRLKVGQAHMETVELYVASLRGYAVTAG